MRSVWDAYYPNTNGIIYVIDSSDTSHFEESKNEFMNILSSEDLKNALILVYANKQDDPNAKNIADLIQIYDLDTISSHTWHIQSCSAKTGDGLVEGLRWLSDQLIYRNTRFPNNPYILETSMMNDESMRMNNNSTILNNSVGEEMTKHFEDLDSSEINDDLNMSK